MKQTANNQGQMIANFYTVHYAELVNFATSRLGNREEGEDLVQDVFIKMMSFEGMINEETIKSFAFTIAANKVKDLLRRRIFRHKMEENAKYEMELQHSLVERMAEYHDTLRMVNDSMARLSPACAKEYRMSLFEDMTAGDIAQEMNVSKRTVESQLFTSRKQVRAMLSVAM
ncbi:sigma-70 family RNA polymerase sigma factor [Prevotella copri]|uniref:Sigma-70 family RNA polymerase sigma factor n=1 Tax=Segatella copri TaxID=165179 RepID=A0AA90VHS5_9BACT|nr:sigma-70 family RNA polymerase sigma factor [Segatella copri]MQO10485.1 sigma-70 family RNA polymerase sigma factor [Segatella copri]